MSGPEKPRRQYLTIKAINPISGKALEVLVSYDRMQNVAKRSLGHAKECGFLVPWVLQHPTAVFEGLRSDEDEDPAGYGWRCYCGVPDRGFRADGAERPAWPREVYLVFVNDQGIAYNWRWEKADDEQGDLPRGYKTRFKKRLI